ncbi:hypothetical protein G7Y79_00031g065680 [Physcia stellaris]|nr:hypothetical protein G7Y79_00031g065680 [Physcia stellaris]
MSVSSTLNPALFNPGLYRSILNLWFKDLPSSASSATPQALGRWFAVGVTPEARAAFDTQCSSTAKDALVSIGPERYPLPQPSRLPLDEQTVPKIAAPLLAQITQSRDPAPEETALAMILLLDQFTRNCFRDKQALIYNHYDRISRSVLQEIRNHGFDRHARYHDSPAWSMWFYMPLTHSEDPEDHKRYMDILLDMRGRMHERGDADAVKYLETNIGFERKHNVILEKFGRYPHRNEVLGRESTAEERNYLENGGETFGT